MAKHPVIKDEERAKTWFAEGLKKKPDCLFEIREKKNGRSAAGEWISVSSVSQIPTGLDFLVRRTSDDAEVYITLDIAEGADGASLPQPELVNAPQLPMGIRGELEQELRTMLQSVKIAAEVSRQSIENSQKAVALASESLTLIVKTRDDASNQDTENAKATAIKALSLLGQRGLGMLADHLNKQKTTQEQHEFQQFQALKAHLLTRNIDISKIPPSGMAVLAELYSNPVMRESIDEVLKEQIVQTSEGMQAMSKTDEDK